MTKRMITALAGLGLMASTLGACSTLGGAALGAGAGAAVGGVVGNATGNTARGAIIGAVVGGAAGAIIGHQMDQQAKEIKQQIPGAVVERVGEGLQVTFESGLLFPYDSDVLTAAAQQNLTTFAASLDKYPNTSLLIVGHTDAVGSDSYNQNLSQRRARSTASYLVSQGVSVARLQTVGRGETEPVASNETEAGMQKNRRVEVAIYASDAYRNQLRSQYKSGL